MWPSCHILMEWMRCISRGAPFKHSAQNSQSHPCREHWSSMQPTKSTNACASRHKSAPTHALCIASTMRRGRKNRRTEERAGAEPPPPPELYLTACRAAHGENIFHDVPARSHHPRRLLSAVVSTSLRPLPHKPPPPRLHTHPQHCLITISTAQRPAPGTHVHSTHTLPALHTFCERPCFFMKKPLAAAILPASATAAPYLASSYPMRMCSAPPHRLSLHLVVVSPSSL
jgi:hypothetical protein